MYVHYAIIYVYKKNLDFLWRELNLPSKQADVNIIELNT